MFAECHAHLFMDGVNYKKAVAAHADKPNETLIRTRLQAYRDAHIGYVREGGDPYGVSSLAKRLAPEYGIEYRSPVFAIHKKGHYGKIVGFSFEDLGEYIELVGLAKRQGADFIKIMTSGILNFDRFGVISSSPLEKELVREMVHIAHEEGMAVMSHTNGAEAVKIAVEAGVDSLEHGNYMDEEAVCMLADSPTIWVPTLVTVRNLRGDGRFCPQAVERIADHTARMLRLAYQKGASLAPGSDAGAYRVLHGQGLHDEIAAFKEILGQAPEVEERLCQGGKTIRERFVRKNL